MIDRSFSMTQGSAPPLEDLKRTMQMIVQNLRGTSQFNFIDFGSSHRRLFERCATVNDENRVKAWQHIQSIKGNHGGTFLFDALKSVFLLADRTPLGDRKVLRNVFVLSDGHVADPDSTLELIKKNAAYTRVFTFGIGESCNRHFIQAMARLVRFLFTCCNFLKNKKTDRLLFFLF